MKDLIAAVRAHAEQRGKIGNWHMIRDHLWHDEDIEAFIGKATTEKEAIRLMGAGLRRI